MERFRILCLIVLRALWTRGKSRATPPLWHPTQECEMQKETKPIEEEKHDVSRHQQWITLRQNSAHWRGVVWTGTKMQSWATLKVYLEINPNIVCMRWMMRRICEKQQSYTFESCSVDMRHNAESSIFEVIKTLHSNPTLFACVESCYVFMKCFSKETFLWYSRNWK